MMMTYTYYIEGQYYHVNATTLSAALQTIRQTLGNFAADEGYFTKVTKAHISSAA